MHAYLFPRKFARSMPSSMMMVATAFAQVGAQEVERAGGPPDSAAALTIEPLNARLIGRRATAQLLATSRAPDSSVEDQTRAVQWVSLSPEVAQTTARGQILPRANGTATIVARLGSLEAHTTAAVRMDRPAPVSFRRDVIPAFSQADATRLPATALPQGRGVSPEPQAVISPTRISESFARPADGGSTAASATSLTQYVNRWAKCRTKGTAADARNPRAMSFFTD